MKLDFDFESVEVVEFGVELEDDNGELMLLVPVDETVQQALREMARVTWSAMQGCGASPREYEPAERYESTEYVYLPLNDQLAARMSNLYKANNLLMDVKALSEPSRIFSYFARMKDEQGRRLLALRRAAQFKGILKSRLLQLVSDALRIIDDNVFKLDNDFDLLVDSSYVHIWRPRSFEFVGKLQEEVLATVSENAKRIQHDLPFVDISTIEEYCSDHPRAARYLASICSQKQTKNIDKKALIEMCGSTGVGIKEKEDKIIVPKEHIVGFLEVLDRRRYEVELVRGSPERYKASNRQKISE